jgi:HSP20 family protein
MTQKDISVEIQDNVLTIKGERKEEEEKLLWKEEEVLL